MGEKERVAETGEEAERRLNGLPPGNPVDPAGIAIGDPGVNGNISDDPAEAAINNSHSNIKNLRTGEGGGPDPAETAINNSHSNIKNLRESPAKASGGRTGSSLDEAGVTGDPTGGDEERASNLNLSKSNID